MTIKRFECGKFLDLDLYLKQKKYSITKTQN